MPSFITVIEDTSPLLVYGREWRAGTSETDNLMDQYTENTFTLTQSLDSSMSFDFYGSYIGVFGAKRNNHGSYTVQLDKTSYPTFNGQSNTALFNQTLFEVSTDLGTHKLTITNLGTTFFDVDYIALETSIGQADENLVVNTFPAGHPAFQYMPISAWTTPSNPGTFSGGSGRATTTGGAKAVLTFEGDVIMLYGPVGPNSTGSYLVQIDNGPTATFNANKQFYRSQQILFLAGNLGKGNHTLNIQLPSPPSGELAIDYANTYSAPSLGGSYLIPGGPSNLPAEPSPTPSSKIVGGTSGPSIPLLAGTIILGVLFIFSGSLNCYQYWRRARILATKPRIDPPRNLDSIEPYTLSPSESVGFLSTDQSQNHTSPNNEGYTSIKFPRRGRTARPGLSTDGDSASSPTLYERTTTSPYLSPTNTQLTSSPLGGVDDGTGYITLHLRHPTEERVISDNPPPLYS